VTLLVLEGVDVSRGGTPVLHDVAMEVGERESICLLGRNGMGKTTLLRTIMGLTPSAAGRIAFDGAEIERRRPHAIAAAGIGYVPQGRGIFSSLSVEDNLRVGSRGRAAAGSLVEVYDLFPILAERRRQRGGTLSGGEQQLLAIARCLIARPKLLLLDEPTEGLQPTIVQQLRELLPTIRDRFGVACLLVEQNLDFAFGVAERGYVLERGAIALSGTVDELRDHELIIEYLGV
jgi:urea ABC transporter ATP-binding protein UrtE